MKPSDFLAPPMGSITQNLESEIVARNIMVVLSRNGDVFRLLSWDEYKKQREIDGNFTEAEWHYFDKVIDYCQSEATARLFSPVWEKS